MHHLSIIVITLVVSIYMSLFFSMGIVALTYNDIVDVILILCSKIPRHKFRLLPRSSCKAVTVRYLKMVCTVVCSSLFHCCIALYVHRKRRMVASIGTPMFMLPVPVYLTLICEVHLPAGSRRMIKTMCEIRERKKKLCVIQHWNTGCSSP